MLEVLREELEAPAGPGGARPSPSPGSRAAATPRPAAPNGADRQGPGSADATPGVLLPSASALLLSCPPSRNRIPRSNEPFGRLCEKSHFCSSSGLAFAASALAELSKYKDWDQVGRGLLPDARGADRVEERHDRRGRREVHRPLLRQARAASRSSRRSPGASPRPTSSSSSPRYKRGPTRSAATCSSSLGPPSRAVAARAQEGALDDTAGVTAPAIDTRVQGGTSAAITYTWTWDKDKLPPAARACGARRRRSRWIRAAAPTSCGTARQVEKAMATLAEKSIVNPNATLAAAPPARRRRPAAAPAAPAAAAPPAGAAAGRRRGGAARPRRSIPLPAAVKTALESAPNAVAGEAGLLVRARSVPSTATISSPCSSICRRTSRPSPAASAAEVRRHRHRRVGQGSRVVLGGRDVLGGGRGQPQGSRHRQVGRAAARQLQGQRSASLPPRGSRRWRPRPSLQARRQDDGVRGLAADSLERPRSPDQAPRSDGSVRLRNGEAHQGRAQGRPRVLQAGQPLVLLRGRPTRRCPLPPRRPRRRLRPRRRRRRRRRPAGSRGRRRRRSPGS